MQRYREAALLAYDSSQRAFSYVGNVNSGVGNVEPVVSINGEFRSRVFLGVNEPFSIAVSAPPSGPESPHYSLFLWPGESPRPHPLQLGSELLGYTINPTPFSLAPPHPLVYLGSGASLFRGCPLPRVHSPMQAPFTLVTQESLPRGDICSKESSKTLAPAILLG